MKKNVLFPFLFVLLFGFSAFSQVTYSDDFESYAVGSRIASQAPDHWRTWSGTAGGLEDPQISDSYANNGAKSLKITTGNDAVLMLSSLNSGVHSVEFYLYVPSGKQAYYNLLQTFNASNSVWGTQLYFQNGILTIDGAGYGVATSTYSSNEWIKIKHIVDLDNDLMVFYVNGTLVYAFEWSRGVNDDGSGTATLNAVNFYAWDEGGSPEYYIDQLTVKQETLPQAATNFSYSLNNGNDIVLTWNQPSSGTPSYAIERDGRFLSTATGTSYTDANLYPATYNYRLITNWGDDIGVAVSNSLQVPISGGVDRKLVLYEIFTGTWCGYCPTSAKAIDQMMNENYDIAVLAYHGGDSYEIAATGIRTNYYKQVFGLSSIGYPGNFINGEVYSLGALANVSLQKQFFVNHYNNIIDIPSLYSIQLQGAVVSERNYTLEVTVKEEFSYYDDEIRLFVALTETNIPQQWQGLQEVNHVVREMYPNAQGSALSFSEDNTAQSSFSITIPESYVLDKCELIVYVQHVASGRVLQADKMTLPDFMIYSVGETDKPKISLFPNPSTGYVQCKASLPIEKLEIFSIQGKCIHSMHPCSNNITVNTPYPAGIYLVKMTIGDAVYTEKIIIN